MTVNGDIEQDRIELLHSAEADDRVSAGLAAFNAAAALVPPVRATYSPVSYSTSTTLR